MTIVEPTHPNPRRAVMRAKAAALLELRPDENGRPTAVATPVTEPPLTDDAQRRADARAEARRKAGQLLDLAAKMHTPRPVTSA